MHLKYSISFQANRKNNPLDPSSRTALSHYHVRYFLWTKKARKSVVGHCMFSMSGRLTWAWAWSGHYVLLVKPPEPILWEKPVEYETKPLGQSSQGTDLWKLLLTDSLASSTSTALKSIASHPWLKRSLLIYRRDTHKNCSARHFFPEIWWDLRVCVSCVSLCVHMNMGMFTCSSLCLSSNSNRAHWTNQENQIYLPSLPAIINMLSGVSGAA